MLQQKKTVLPLASQPFQHRTPDMDTKHLDLYWDLFFGVGNGLKNIVGFSRVTIRPAGLLRSLSKTCGSSRVGSEGARSIPGRVESGRARRCSKYPGTGRVGSGQKVFEISRDGSGGVGSEGVRNIPGRVGLGRVRRLSNMTGRVGSGDPGPT